MKNASSRRPTLQVKAPAKVNLALAVGPARPGDGFHPICSWMAPIDLCDEITMTRLEDDRLSRYAVVWHQEAPRTSAIDWAITKDLGVRAHHLLERHVGRSLPIQMKVEKRIPVGGGLGGGSSDAAAVLRAVRELFALEIDDGVLAGLALDLGSDVPFFLGDSPALVEGLGEKVTPVGRVGAHLVLILPAFGCPTGPVYRAFDALPAAAMREEEVRRMAGAGGVVSERLFNDLAAAAEAVAPELAPLRAAAARAIGRPVHVTGSGSTLFVVCGDAGEASAAARTIESGVPGCAVAVTRLA